MTNWPDENLKGFDQLVQSSKTVQGLTEVSPLTKKPSYLDFEHHLTGVVCGHSFMAHVVIFTVSSSITDDILECWFMVLTL